MKNRIFRLFLCLLLPHFLSEALYSQNVLNPVNGTWANKQVLIIDLEPGENAFYSFGSQNPETFGLAYDGPVLLDVDGEVKLNVLVAKNNGQKILEVVNYSVKPAEMPYEDQARDFIQKVEFSGVYDYNAGSQLHIPSSLEYCLGRIPDGFEKGTVLSVPEGCIVSRFVPCTLSSGKDLWRFIIKIQPVISGTFSRKDVPFEISDWEDIKFSDLKLLYKLDDEYWMQKKTGARIDRSKNHMISWQSINYSKDNDVNYFVIPPKPELVVTEGEKGSVSVKFAEGTPEGYKIGILSASGTGSELYDSIQIDTFQGDAWSGKLNLGIYYDSVYQGKKSIDFNVYKKIPKKPEFISSAKDFVSRKPVTLKIKSDGAKEIYYSVQGPVVLENENYEESSSMLLNLQGSSFKRYSKPLTFEASMDGACLYKIQSYSIDGKNEKSSVAVYSIIIDQCNFYINPDSDAAVSDGSEKAPFKSFAEFLPYLNQTRFANVRISGDVALPKGNTLITTNCQISGDEHSKLIVPLNSSLVVRNSSLTLKNCLIEHAGFGGKTSTECVFNVVYGVLDFTDCEILVPFARSGNFIKAEKSVVNFNHTGATVTSRSYASVVASVDSKIFVRDSIISSISETSVLFSVQGGLFELGGSNCKISGTIGRIAELFDSQSVIRNNLFQAEISRPAGSIKSVYMDSNNISIEFANNQESGF